METPSQLIERLERMGEQRVRALLRNGHFEAKKLGAVQGWLNRKDQEREAARGPRPDPAEAALAQARAQIEEITQSATKAAASARTAQRLAVVALSVGGAGLLVAVMALFALALR